jgi:hypothetical protein
MDVASFVSAQSDMLSMYAELLATLNDLTASENTHRENTLSKMHKDACQPEFAFIKYPTKV